MSLECYAVRRLAPFRGTLQVMQVADGRAYSADGISWKVELLSREPVRLSPWGDAGPAASERRYFTYGLWTTAGGLERVPLNAILGDQSDHPALPRLLAALEGLDELPFALSDRLELWLLDARDHLPLALLRSQTGNEAPPPIPRMQLNWRAMARDPGGATAPAAGDSATGELAADEVPALERQLWAAAGGADRAAQWFRRGEDGAGDGLGLVGGPSQLAGRRLPAAAFPQLLVRDHWRGDPAHQARMDAYVQRLAPALLTLPLATPLRARLEPLAARHPRRLYGYRRLLPAIVDRELITAALVAARLEQAAGSS